MREGCNHFKKFFLVFIGGYRIIENELKMWLYTQSMVDIGNICNGLVFDTSIIKISSHTLWGLDTHVNIFETSITQELHSSFVDEFGFNEDFKGKADLFGVKKKKILEPIEVKIEHLVIETNAPKIPMLLGLFYLLDHGSWCANAKPLLSRIHIFLISGIVTIATFVDTASWTHHLKDRIPMHGVTDRVGISMN